MNTVSQPVTAPSLPLSAFSPPATRTASPPVSSRRSAVPASYRKLYPGLK